MQTDRRGDANPDGGGATWQNQVDDDGEFRRKPTQFHGSIGAHGTYEFPAEAGRYHLYVSFACPWAHRTLLTRELKGLTDAISVDVVDTYLSDGGWTLHGEEVGATGDRVHGYETLREVYETTTDVLQSNVTVPVLYDKRLDKIVNNESSEIIRQLNSEFQDYAESPELDLYPEALREDIDAVNSWVYEDINNGVYRAGFARSQAAYERAARRLFDALDRAESILDRSRYLVGSALTEADVRLFPTLVRFDLVYHTHFKCNLRRLVDYPNLWAYTRDIYAQPGVASTINVDHVKKHYYCSHESINPFRIVPIGPELDFTQANGRAERFG